MHLINGVGMLVSNWKKRIIRGRKVYLVPLRDSLRADSSDFVFPAETSLTIAQTKYN